MEKRPDGVFTTNDFFAAVFQQTLKENDIKVPEDIAIVGFNNDAISRVIQPKLSTINYPGEEMGEQAARSLLEVSGPTAARRGQVGRDRRDPCDVTGENQATHAADARPVDPPMSEQLIAGPLIEVGRENREAQQEPA